MLVTNGVYDQGGLALHVTMTNRIAITNAITVQSVNGPTNTFIVGSEAPGGGTGGGAVRCAYVGSSATVVGFTLTNGHTRKGGAAPERYSGGGVSRPKLCAGRPRGPDGWTGR